jgi:hypothetical protein
MLTQEGVPLLSVLYFLPAHIVICGDSIPGSVVAIGLVSLSLSPFVDKVSDEVDIHFATQLFGFSGDLLPVRMLFDRGLPNRLTHFHLCGNLVDLCASLYQLIGNKEISVVHIHCVPALYKLRPGDSQVLGHRKTDSPPSGRICRHGSHFDEDFMRFLLLVRGGKQGDQKEEQKKETAS